MPTIVVRGLEPELVRRLKMFAARHGRSMEEEVRQLLRERIAMPGRQTVAATLMSVPGYGWEWPQP